MTEQVPRERFDRLAASAAWPSSSYLPAALSNPKPLFFGDTTP